MPMKCFTKLTNICTMNLFVKQSGCNDISITVNGLLPKNCYIERIAFRKFRKYNANQYEKAANETQFIIFRTRDITVGSIFVYVNYIKRVFFLADKSSVGCHMIQSTKHLVLLFKQEVQFSEQIPSKKYQVQF